MLISNQLIMKARSLLVLVVLISLHGTALADESEIAFDIDAQELGAALNEFALQSNKEILFVEAETADKSATKVSGTFAPTAALDLLLTDTGLDYRVNELDTVLVGVAAEQRGASDSKNLSPTPVLMAQNQPSQAQATVSSRSSEGGTSIVTGKVTDARTGANLKGAKVTIEETGQWTSTNDLGEFRFVNVPTGSATLTVSYLGYAGQAAVVGVRSDGASQNFALRGGSEIEEIMVYGTRSSRSLSLNQERTSANSSTVISSDLLGNFDGTTISDSLRRSPGIAFVPDRTGEGANIIIRGLGPDLNQITLNGVRLPVSDGLSRSATLTNVLTESISKVTINKTLLPSHDSSGAGGLVEIETKGPLDRPSRFVQFALDRAQAEDSRFRKDTAVSGTIAGTFGDKQDFGVSASVQYRDLSTSSLSYSSTPVFGQYLPLDDNGDPVTQLSPFDDPLLSVDPRRTFPFEPDVNHVYPANYRASSSEVSVENSSINISVQKQFGSHTEWRLDYSRLEREEDAFSRSANFIVFPIYELIARPELSGEQRASLVWEDSLGPFGLPGNIARYNQTYTFARDFEQTTDTVSFRGETDARKWHLKYDVGFTKGESNSPNRADLGASVNQATFAGSLVDASLLQEQALSNTIDGRLISPFPRYTANGGRFILPLLNEAGFDSFNNPDNFVFGGGTLSGTSGENKRVSAKISARFEIDWPSLKYIEAGIFVEDATFENVNPLYSSTVRLVPDTTLSDLGLAFDDNPFSRIGVSNGFNFLSIGSVNRFLANAEALSEGSVPVTIITPNDSLDPRRFDAALEERELTGYIQARVDVGNFEFIGGARISHIETKSINLTNPSIIDSDGVVDNEFAARFRQLLTQTDQSTSIEPRILVNYRPNDKNVFRAGYYQTVQRPQVQSLSALQIVTLDLRPSQLRLSVSEGNPALKPATTHNYDLSYEHYLENVGQVKISAFYTKIDNLLEQNSLEGFSVLDGVLLPDDPRFDNLPTGLTIAGIRPQNSPADAEAWGIEFSAERQFTNLPGIWSGFGSSINYSYTDSEKTEIFQFSEVPEGEVRVDGIPFNQQANHTGTAAISYNKYGIDSTIAYTYQARFPRFARRNGLGQNREPIDTLDFRIEKRFERGPVDIRVFFEGSDLLNSTGEPDLQTSVGGKNGVEAFVIGEQYLGGRVLRIGAIGSF